MRELDSIIMDGGRWVLRCKAHPRRGVCATRHCEESTSRRHCARCRKRVSRLNNPWAARWNLVKQRARARGQRFTIGAADIKSAICAAGLKTEFLRNPSSIHIDRIDPLRGYEPGNIQAMRWRDNLVKAAQDRVIHQESRKEESNFWDQESPF